VDTHAIVHFEHIDIVPQGSSFRLWVQPNDVFTWFASHIPVMVATGMCSSSLAST